MDSQTPSEGVPAEGTAQAIRAEAQALPRHRWTLRLRSIALVALVGALATQSVGLIIATRDLDSAMTRLRGDARNYENLQTTNEQLSASLASMTAAQQVDQTQIATLKSQVDSLTRQVAALQAELPPTSGCPGDPGFRATVNQISTQTVGFSATQRLIDYFCVQGITAPGQVQLFFDSHSLAYLEQNFGYP